MLLFAIVCYFYSISDPINPVRLLTLPVRKLMQICKLALLIYLVRPASRIFQ